MMDSTPLHHSPSQSSQPAHPQSKPQVWYRPTVAPEHGIDVVLLVSFLTGAAAAQDWNWSTTLAFLCGFCGFQAEHPLVLQIKQRCSLKLRLNRAVALSLSYHEIAPKILKYYIVIKYLWYLTQLHAEIC